MMMDTSDRFRTHGLVAAAVGLVLAFLSLDAQFLLGAGPKWNDPAGDLSAYITAATYYVNDAWRFPLLSIPDMGYPEGGSVIYNDAIPLAALPAKLVSRTLGISLNYLGPWMLLCYVLQALVAARLAFVAGNRSILATAGFAAFVTGCASFLLRAQHTALCSTFLLFWAYLAYLRTREPDVKLARTVLPPVFAAFLINPYLFGMVAPIVGAGLLSAWRSPAVRRQFVSTVALGAAISVVLLFGLGFASTGVGLRRLADSGFGHASWNPAMLFVPIPHGLWEPLTDGIVRDATRGQFEGESYLGLVPLVLLFAWLWLHPRDLLALMRRHGVLLLVLVGYGLYAMSNRGFVRSIQLWDVDLPGRVMELMSVFRASGRFVWPMMYLMMLVPGIGLLRRASSDRHRIAWAVLIALGGIVQVAEVTADRHYMKAWSRQPSPDLVGVDTMRALVARHSRIWQFPSYFCGGLGSYMLAGDLHRERQIQVLAAKAGKPTNSIYMSRPLKDCDRERREAEQLALQPGVLYIFSKDAVRQLSNLETLTRTAQCRDAGWSYLCSTAFRSVHRDGESE